MSTWLYQMNQKSWDPRRYRLEIWEGQNWKWRVGRIISPDQIPAAGDVIALFYAISGGEEYGFYGWAVIMEWLEDAQQVIFRPVAPSDHLKMDPWGNDDAQELANSIRGKVKQGTLWFVDDEKSKQLRNGIAQWLGAVTKR